MFQHKIEHIILIILLIIAAFGSFFVYLLVSDQQKTLIQQQETINALTRQISTFPNYRGPTSIVDENSGSGTSGNLKSSYDFSRTFRFYNDANEFYGTLILKGYLQIDKRIPCAWEKPNCFINIARFIVIKPPPEFIEFYNRGFKGNSFITENSINLGCFDEEKMQINSYTASLSFTDYAKEYHIRGSDLNLLLNSSIKKPATLQAVRYLTPNGGEADDCYSHFTDYKVF